MQYKSAHGNGPIVKSTALRSASFWAGLALVFVFGLSIYKTSAMNDLASRGIRDLKVRHLKLSNLFQASFYFFYDDQFLPGVQQALAESGTPRLERLTILSNGNGSVLFDSSALKKPDESARPSNSVFPDEAVIQRLNQPEASVFMSGFRIRVLEPGPQYGILYDFGANSVRNRIAWILVVGLVWGAFMRWLLSRQLSGALAVGALRTWRGFWRLRVKFLATIILINVITATILFFSLVKILTREQAHRIERDSFLFAQFSTAQVIANFTGYYYFYFNDRFLPETKRIIAANENLVRMRIISHHTGGVLFDSEQPGNLPLAGAGEATKADFTSEVQEQLKGRDLVTQTIDKDGERLLSVISTYRNENQEPLFWVEYFFTNESLKRSILAIRRQILIDLVPSMALGLLIAVVFAQLLISPIRRLMAALNKVATGDYEVSLDIPRRDELGELVTAFNSMTEELRRKKELRKYLSDSTYRQVMKSPDANGNIHLGGSRVSATVLFSDIRNFVGHCEAMEAEEVTTMLNEYFSEMVEVVYKHGGEVDKFIGDALLAVFYAADESRTIRPGEGSNLHSGMPGPTASATSLQAVYCAIEMRERLAEFNERRKAQQKAVIEIGVGITHGEIISGPIGSKDRMDFTVIGDVVNMASRIEKLSKRGRHTKIVFSNHVEEKVRGLLEYEEMESEKVRGKEEIVRTFELIGVRDIQFLVQNLKGQDLGLRRRSVELLGQSRNAGALPWVTGALHDADELTRLQAVIAVSKLAPGDDEKAFDSLLVHLKGERSDKVVSALVSCIGKLSNDSRIDRMIEVLRPLLNSPNERIVANAVEAMGQVRNPRCTDLILPKLSSRNNRVKANAAMAIFAAGHIEVIDTLKPMLMHSEGLMRSSAAFAIGELTVIAEQDHLITHWKERTQTLKFFLAELQECVPMLVALLRDGDPMVRRQSIIALGKIKDKSAVLPIIGMLEPGQDSRELIQDISQALRSIGSHKLVREVIARLSTPS